MPLSNPPVTSGSDHMFALLEFVKDPAAVAARVAELRAAEADAVAALQAVGDAKEIPLIRAQAQRDAQIATDSIRNARLEAERIVSGAQAELVQAKAEAATIRADAAKGRKALKDAQVEWEQRHTATVAELRQREQAIAQAQSTAQTAEHDALVLKAEWEARVAKLRAAMGG